MTLTVKLSPHGALRLASRLATDGACVDSDFIRDTRPNRPTFARHAGNCIRGGCGFTDQCAAGHGMMSSRTS
eukprot:5371-Eustigmatos_ZCMA.PRE.1